MVYLGSWSCNEDVARDFCIDNKLLEGVEMLLAYYGLGDYEGGALVLFERDGKLYEVYGSHCSCYGLEDQWDPYETSIAELQHRLEHGNCFTYYDGDLVSNHLKQILQRYE